MTRKEEVAWAAGLFEGEGSFGLSRKRIGGSEYTYATARLGMTDRETVERFRDVFGVGTFYEHRRSNPAHNTMFYWQVQSREDFAEFVTLIEPWLSQRRLKRLAEIEAQVSPVRRVPPPRTVCSKGHPLVGYNRKPNGRGRVACRRCINDRARQRYAKAVTLHDE